MAAFMPSNRTEFHDSLVNYGWATNRMVGAPQYADLDRFVSTNYGLESIGRRVVLKPVEAALARSGTLSARHGLAKQPLHTDCANWPTPPRFMSLFGNRVSGTIVETNLCRPDFVALAADEASLVSKVWTFQVNGFKGFYSKSIERKNGIPSIRFDANVMNPFDKAVELGEFIERNGHHETFVVDQGGWILIDNWSCLHGRGEVENFNADREIERLYWGYNNGMGF